MEHKVNYFISTYEPMVLQRGGPESGVYQFWPLAIVENSELFDIYVNGSRVVSDMVQDIFRLATTVLNETE
jgi:hypothetical protein